MRLKPQDVRALGALLLAVVVAGILYWTTAPPAPAVVSTDLPAILEQRLNRLRRVAATVPAKQQALLALEEQARTREKRVLVFRTVAQAQAHLLEVSRRLASANKIDAKGGDFSAPKQLGADYGEVAVLVNFECGIEQFLNFLADLSKEPELIAPAEVRVSTANPKNKTINVRITLAGIVAKSLVPQKKGFSVL